LQGKALAALICVAAAGFLTGCGGGNSPREQSSSSPSSAEEGPQLAAQGNPEIRQLREEARKLQRRRERKERSQKAGTGPEAVVPAPPGVFHRDSGGGAGQFRTRSGDDSIQDSGVEAAAAERERAAAALHDYLDLRAAHHWAGACTYMAASLIVLLERAVAISPRSSKPKGCPAVLAAMSGAVPQRVLDKLAEVDVGSLRLNGRRGFLLYHGPQGKGYAMLVAKENGEWKVTALDGTVLP
jgi:hypothetical protein